MARKPMSETQKKARAKKAAATRQAKQEAAMSALGLEPRKKVRKRRTMTPEQKAAAAERLAKARAARAAKNPDKKTSRPEIFSRYTPDHPLSYEKTKENLAYQQELLKSYKLLRDSSNWQDRCKYTELETHILHLKSYLTSGVYSSLFYGKEAQNKTKYHCVKMAYYSDGTPKRTQGVYYNDIDKIWTGEEEVTAKRKRRNG